MLRALARLEQLPADMQRLVLRRAGEGPDLEALRELALREDLVDDVDAALLGHDDVLVAARRLVVRPRPAATVARVVDRAVHMAGADRVATTTAEQDRVLGEALLACAAAELDTRCQLALVGSGRRDVIDALVATRPGAAPRQRLAGAVIDAAYAVRAPQVGHSLHSDHRERQMLALAAHDPRRWLEALVAAGWVPSSGWHLFSVAGLLEVGSGDELAAALGEMLESCRSGRGRSQRPRQVEDNISQAASVGLVRHGGRADHAQRLLDVVRRCGVMPSSGLGQTMRLLAEQGPRHLALVEQGRAPAPWVGGTGLLAGASVAGVLHLAERWVAGVPATPGGCDGSLLEEVLVAAQAPNLAAKGLHAALRRQVDTAVEDAGPLHPRLVAHGLTQRWLSPDEAVAASGDLRALLTAVAEHPRNGALGIEVLEAISAAGRSEQLPCAAVVGPGGFRALLRDEVAARVAAGLDGRVAAVDLATALFEEFDGTVAELIAVCRSLADGDTGPGAGTGGAGARTGVRD